MKKLRILQVNKFYPPVIGGVEKVVQQVAEEIQNEFDVKVLVCQKKGPATDEMVNGISVHRSSSCGVFFSMPVSFSFLIDFRKLSKENDIVHIHMPFPMADLACFLSGYKGKVVLWWHSDIIRQKVLMPFYKPLMHWLLNRADAIVVATQGHIDDSKYLKYYAHKCVVIPFTLDRELFADACSFLNEAPQKKENEISFLFLGRLVPYKGIDVLLQAFADLNDLPARLIIAGMGPEEEKLRRLCAHLGIESKVTFTGIATEKEKYLLYRNCDVFVLPSITPNEAFGIVQLEAMAYGKPVINTALPGGVPHVSLHRQTGLTVPPSNVASLASAMRELAQNADMRRQFGKAGAKRAADFTQNFKSKICNLYQSLMEGTNKGDEPHA